MAGDGMIEKSYYRPSEIIFNKYQLTTFLLPHLSELMLGNYPPEQTGYFGYSSGHSNKSPYADAVEIGAEITARLNMIGERSDILIQIYELDWEDIQVAKYWHIDEERVKRLSIKMLRYITGKRRPEVDYNTWLKNGMNKYPAYNLINDILEFIFPVIKERGTTKPS